MWLRSIIDMSMYNTSTPGIENNTGRYLWRSEILCSPMICFSWSGLTSSSTLHGNYWYSVRRVEFAVNGSVHVPPVSRNIASASWILLSSWFLGFSLLCIPSRDLEPFWRLVKEVAYRIISRMVDCLLELPNKRMLSHMESCRPFMKFSFSTC